MSEVGRQETERPWLLHWTIQMEKQVCDRVNTVLTDTMLMAAFQRFGGKIFRRSSVFHGLGKFLADNRVKGECCFEIGTWNGLTAALLSRHFAKVVTVDIAHNDLKHDVLRHLGITNVECIDIKNNEYKSLVLKDLAERGIKIDCAYLDGNHAEDTEDDWALVRDCGRVIFHECWPFQSPVWQLVHTLPQKEVVFGGCGLALWDGRC